ncbi:hypothetical protein DMUE_2014 [Dictyocoela muelleri]|nr:hypothetical protein DMUE_2014 [Dictyocoela muelleri]
MDTQCRINRWLLLLEEYDFPLKHVCSSNNNEADILSRAMIIQDKNNDMCANVLNDIINKLNLLNNAQITEKEKQHKVFEMLKEIHVILVHPGRNKMFETLKNYVKIKNLK